MTNPIVETGREAAEVIKIPEGPPAPGASVPGRRHPPSSLEKEWRTLQELGLGSRQQQQPAAALSGMSVKTLFQSRVNTTILWQTGKPYQNMTICHTDFFSLFPDKSIVIHDCKVSGL